MVPISHAIGFYGTLLVTLAYNGTFYTMSAFNPVAANDLIERHKINYLFSVPTLYQAMVSAPNYKPEKMASLDLVLYGGAPIMPALLDRIDREWPATVRHIYGTTEIMCALYNPEPVGRPVTLRPGYYSRVRVVRHGGNENDLVKPGEAGELIVDASADTFFSGYLNRPDANAEKLRNGWYFTGDVCVMREDGDVDLVGRVDDVIRSGGESVYPGGGRGGAGDASGDPGSRRDRCSRSALGRDGRRLRGARRGRCVLAGIRCPLPDEHACQLQEAPCLSDDGQPAAQRRQQSLAPESA